MVVVSDDMKKTGRKRRGARLGQHLLTNGGIAYAVAVASGAKKGSMVYEVGPGKGMLTRELVKLGARVVAVEKDPLMVALLNEAFKNEIQNKELKIIEGDARDYGPDSVFPKETYVIAANIPYYITGELIQAALTAKNQPVSAAFLVQKEVAERIARSKKESILSLSVKVYGTPRYVKTVSRGSFNPPPSVDSAILAITNISRNNFANVSEEAFFNVVKAGFAQKRKTLGGNLKKSFGEAAARALKNSGIAEGARAEDVPLELWLALAKTLG